MTIKQDALRADLRASMTAETPDYLIDSEAGRRVGKIIGGTAAHDERKIRASDSRGHSTDKLPDEQRVDGPNLGLWITASAMSLATVALQGMLAYWRFS